MLTLSDGSLHEGNTSATFSIGGQNMIGDYYGHPLMGQYITTYHWNSYPCYITTDKTAKAIEIIKALQSDKIIDVKSVNKFIELVERIVNLL